MSGVPPSRIHGYKDARISLYLAPLLDSKSKSELSETSGASQRYGASEQSRPTLRYGISERFGGSESSGVSIEEQRGEGLSKNGEEEGEDALFVAGGGEFEGAGEEFAEKLAL